MCIVSTGGLNHPNASFILGSAFVKNVSAGLQVKLACLKDSIAMGSLLTPLYSLTVAPHNLTIAILKLTVALRSFTFGSWHC